MAGTNPDIASMSAENQTSFADLETAFASESTNVDSSNEFPYRAISRSAIWATVLGGFSLAGYLSIMWPVLALTGLGIVLALFSLRSIRKYPNEFSGRGLAFFALMMNLTILVTGSSFHTYVYLTEVPAGYERIGFNMLRFDGEPDRYTEASVELDGKDVFVKGYIHPASGTGMLNRFIIVGDLQTCCFGGQPKSSEMIEITLKPGQTMKAGDLAKRKLIGKFWIKFHPCFDDCPHVHLIPQNVYY